MSENLNYWDDLIHNPPDCWDNFILGNLFDQRKEKQFDHLPLLAVTGNVGVVPRDTLERRDTSNADKGKYLKVEKGDIVYNTMRMWQGVSGMSNYIGIVSPAYTVCKPKSEIISSFAKYLFKLPYLVQVFHKRAQGLVDDTLNLKYESFSKIKVVVPPLPEQQKIASILTSVDAVIEKTEAQIKKLKDLKKAMMQELLTKGIGHTEFKDSPAGRIPVGWEVVLGSKILKLGSGVSPSEVVFSNDGEIMFMKVNDFNHPDNSNEITTTNLSFKEMDNTSVPLYEQGTIVIAKRGAAIFKNRVQLLAKKSSVDTNLMTMVVGSGVNEVFMMNLLEFVKLESIADTTSIPQINNFHLYDMKFICPPLSEQKKIASIFTSIDKSTEERQNKLSHTKLLKKALMQDLLTGKVRVKV